MRYRFRILNGSNARRYRLALDPPPPDGPAFVQIGSDGGLLDGPLEHDAIQLAAAERFDVVIDFGAYPVGTLITVTNALGVGSTDAVMRFRVARDGARDSSACRASSPRSNHSSRAAARSSGSGSSAAAVAGGPAHWVINGLPFDPARMDASVPLGQTEIWRFSSDLHHPVHVHLDPFQVLRRGNRGSGRVGPRLEGHPRPAAAGDRRGRDPVRRPRREVPAALPQPRARGHDDDVRLRDPRLRSRHMRSRQTPARSGECSPHNALIRAHTPARSANGRDHATSVARLSEFARRCRFGGRLEGCEPNRSTSGSAASSATRSWSTRGSRCCSGRTASRCRTTRTIPPTYGRICWCRPRRSRRTGSTSSAHTEPSSRRTTSSSTAVRCPRAAWRRDDPALADRIVLSWQPGLLDRWLEEDEEVGGHPRDPYHRVEVLNSSRHVVVSLDGVTLAESRRPVLLFETSLPTRYYLPEEDVNAEALEPSRAHSFCPYKGKADRYWSVRDRRGRDRHRLVATTTRCRRSGRSPAGSPSTTSSST